MLKNDDELSQQAAGLDEKYRILQKSLSAVGKILDRVKIYSAEAVSLDSKMHEMLRDVYQADRDKKQEKQKILNDLIYKEKGIGLKANDQRDKTFTSKDEFIKNEISYQNQCITLIRMVQILEEELYSRVEFFEKKFTKFKDSIKKGFGQKATKFGNKLIKFIEVLNKNKDENKFHYERALIVMLQFMHTHLLSKHRDNIKKFGLSFHSKLSKKSILTLRDVELSCTPDAATYDFKNSGENLGICDNQNDRYGFGALSKFLLEQGIPSEIYPLNKETIIDMIKQNITNPSIIRDLGGLPEYEAIQIYIQKLDEKLDDISLEDFRELISGLEKMRDEICAGFAKDNFELEKKFLIVICQLITNKCELLKTDIQSYRKNRYDKEKWKVNESDLRSILKEHSQGENTKRAIKQHAPTEKDFPPTIRKIFSGQLLVKATKINKTSSHSAQQLDLSNLNTKKSKTGDSSKSGSPTKKRPETQYPQTSRLKTPRSADSNKNEPPFDASQAPRERSSSSVGENAIELPFFKPTVENKNQKSTLSKQQSESDGLTKKRSTEFK
jgi:hypothetical protein